MGLMGKCCDNGSFEEVHDCQKQTGGPLDTAAPRLCTACNMYVYSSLYDEHMRRHALEGVNPAINGAGIERVKLHASTGRPKGSRNLHAKHPSSIARAFKRAGLDWQVDFAEAIKGNKRERIKLWLRLLPYLITTTNKVKVRKWKGKASKAALIALDALEGKR